MKTSLITLENDVLRVKISSLGAELQSIVRKDSGREYLWQGDPEVWENRAPWLFPIIGQLRGGVYRYKGVEYSMPMHGFAAKMMFDVEQASDTEVRLTLRATEQTLARYPWTFVLSITYVLRDTALIIQCEVRCENWETMYFSIGAHPGFACTCGDVLAFEGAGSLECQRLNLASHLLEKQTVPMAETIVLQEEMFDADAMLIHKPACEGVTLCCRDGARVRIDFGRVPWVGVWTHARAGLKYICIEPWYGVDDPVDAQGDIDHKLDIVRLDPGKVFTMQLTICPQ